MLPSRTSSPHLFPWPSCSMPNLEQKRGEAADSRQGWKLRWLRSLSPTESQGDFMLLNHLGHVHMEKLLENKPEYDLKVKNYCTVVPMWTLRPLWGQRKPTWRTSAEQLLSCSKSRFQATSQSDKSLGSFKNVTPSDREQLFLTLFFIKSTFPLALY